MKRLHVLAMTLLAGMVSFAWAQEPTTRPESRVKVRGWTVLISDPFQPMASSPAVFSDTLPEFVSTKRPRAVGADRDRIMPVGIVRVTGEVGLKVDVQLDAKTGQFNSTWPLARMRGNAAMWRDVALTVTPRNMIALDGRHWLNQFRDVKTPFLFTSDRAEPFLLYDVSLPFVNQLSVASGSAPDTIRYAHAGHAPLHDVVFYRPAANSGWETAIVTDLAAPAGAQPPVPPAPRPTNSAQTQQEASIRQQIQQLEQNRQSIMQSVALQGVDAASLQAYLQRSEDQIRQLQSQLPRPPVQPVVDPSIAASKEAAQEIQLTKSAANGFRPLLEEWTTRLAPYDLEPTDVRAIVSILETQLSDSSRLTAVYRMDDAELQRLLPIEVIPATNDIRRVALVIVRNIDPALPTEVDSLIARLGDRDWKTREQASKELAAVGPVARSKLMSALTSADAEVALRAERLLLQLGVGGPTPAPAPAVGEGIIINGGNLILIR